MAEPDDLTKESPDKVLAEPAPEPAPLSPPSLEARIAELIRANASERKAVTAEWQVKKLAPGLRRQEISATLSSMAALADFADVKAVVAPSGRLYLFSETSLSAEAARADARAEESKALIVDQIRGDSQRTELTPASALEPYFPSPEPEARAAFLAAMLKEERFKDIRILTGVKGEVFYHSDTFVSGAYGQIMMRAKANDPSLAIAEMVRERARTLPRPTRIDLFQDPVFGFPAGEIEAQVEEMLSKAEYTDVKKLVHPTTGAVYLYSEKWMDAEQAFLFMDWDEVGAAKNP